jgi:hypothetical protein
MTDYVFEERRQNYANLIKRPNWGAIWAGVFTFFAIWSVFGVLGLAIFASAANPNEARPVGGMNAGMGIWSVILTIIAMFVAGRVTGHLAGAGNWRDGISHGMIMFGLAVFGILVLVGEGAVALGAPAEAATGGVHSMSLFTTLADIGWPGFFALLLGWLAAMGGASASARREIVPTQQQTRRAA